jgi:hypothetical protein
MGSRILGRGIVRKVMEPQRKLGQVDISEIEFDLQSRDEIPRLLMGLQYIYGFGEVRRKVFRILEKMIPPQTDWDNGRPGMQLWTILVLGMLRLNCNWDFDKVKEMADNHQTLRQMLGHGIGDTECRYPLQTIEDNVSLFTPEILDKINEVVVKAGYGLLGTEPEKIQGRCDSFVVETDVHFPTDINLLLDAMRKIVTLLGRLCLSLGLTAWRQSAHIMRKLKRLYRAAQNQKRRSRKSRNKSEAAVIAAHQEYIEAATGYVEKAQGTIALIREGAGVLDGLIADEIEKYFVHARRQIDQIGRRVIGGQTIPHGEKVFSLFEEHTEWIQKGKAGVAQELGLGVCVMEDQHGFILHHIVMQKVTDDCVAIPIVQETKKRYPTLWSCSFDKGFWTPENRRRLAKILGSVALRSKGRPSEAEQLERSDPEYLRACRQHPAVESAINALENHGLDRCLDHGIGGFRRYVAMAIVARNIQQLGNILFEIAKESLEEQEEPRRKAS